MPSTNPARSIKIREALKRVAVGTAAGVPFFLLFAYIPIGFSILLATALLIALLFEWKKLFPPSAPAFWLIAPVYPILPFVLLILLNQMPEFRLLLVAMFTMVFCFDTGSYIAGKTIGDTLIAPHISPKKTWEGVFGGLIMAYVSLCIWLTALNKPILFIPTAFLILVVGFTALAGDLFESWLKRRVKIKDSGNLLPGHGGILDRFDASLFVGIIFFIFRHQLADFLL